MADRLRRATGPSATSKRRPSRPGAPAGRRSDGRASSCRSTPPARCTGTCGSSTRARSPRGRCRRASRADPKRNNLAVRTEDHPLEYLDFHGEIPAGQYGAGTMRIWDRGTYELHKWRDDEVMVTFHGERVRGQLRPVPHRRQELDDPPDGPAGGPGPRADAGAGRADARAPGRRCRPTTGAGRYEIKWDGVRAIGYVEGGRLRLQSRNGPRHHAALPGAARARPRARRARGGARRRGRRVRRDGRPSFQRLQRRMHLTSERAGAPARASREPVVYMIFDLLCLDGHSLMELPYDERRERARRARSSTGPTWQAPAHHVGDGAALLAASRAQGLEGIVAKRLDCPYTPGPALAGLGQGQERRAAPTSSSAAGCRGEGGRAGRLGALVVGFTTTTASCATRAGSARASPRPSSSALRRPARPARARRRRPFTGRQPPKRDALRRAARSSPRVDYGEWTAAPARCATRSTRACATTWRPRTSGFPE